MKYRIDWMFTDAVKTGTRTYSKEVAERLCKLLNETNAGVSTHWIVPEEAPVRIIEEA